MIDTILKQHTYKTGSIKKLIECRSSSTNEVLCYLVKFTDRLGISLCNMNFHYLTKAMEWYKKLTINYNNERFMTNRGKLTRYALVCGYREEYTFSDGSYKDLWQESACIHVRHIKQDGRIWESFNLNELTKARKFYASIVL